MGAKALNVSVEVARRGHAAATATASAARQENRVNQKVAKMAVAMGVSMEEARALDRRAYEGDVQAQKLIRELRETWRRSCSDVKAAHGHAIASASGDQV